MAITEEFKEAVEEKNLIKLRIMLKDILLVDKSFAKFDEMISYLSAKDIDVYERKMLSYPRADKSLWNTKLLNEELSKLVNEFSKARVYYCREIIRSIYGKVAQPNIESSRVETLKKKDNNIIAGFGTKFSYKSKCDDIIKLSKEIEKLARGEEGFYSIESIKKIKTKVKIIYKNCEDILGKEK